MRSFPSSPTNGGFTPRACRPYRARTKGKVERPVRYLRGRFIYGRISLNDSDLERRASNWLERVANVRLHGTTREQTRVRFDREERFTLQPLALQCYTSLIIERPATTSPTSRTPRPVIAVEKRSVATHAQLTGGVT